jgi:hypothetical protein
LQGGRRTAADADGAAALAEPRNLAYPPPFTTASTRLRGPMRPTRPPSGTKSISSCRIGHATFDSVRLGVV